MSRLQFLARNISHEQRRATSGDITALSAGLMSTQNNLHTRTRSVRTYTHRAQCQDWSRRSTSTRITTSLADNTHSCPADTPCSHNTSSNPQRLNHTAQSHKHPCPTTNAKHHMTPARPLAPERSAPDNSHKCHKLDNTKGCYAKEKQRVRRDQQTQTACGLCLLCGLACEEC